MSWTLIKHTCKVNVFMTQGIQKGDIFPLQVQISQTDLATQLGIHKNVLGRYERNEVSSPKITVQIIV